MKKTNYLLWICTVIIFIASVSTLSNILKISIIVPDILTAPIAFFKYTPELVDLSNENIKVKLVRRLTILTGAFITGIFILIAFSAKLSKDTIENTFLILFTIYILYFGNESPKIPCNKYLGLRLPWTVNNENIWRYTHKIVGYLSFPAGIIMFLVVFFYRLEIGIILGIIMLAIIPSIMSYIFYKKQFYNINTY